MSQLYTRIAANILFPLHERLKKHNSVSVKNRLEKEQWLSSEEQEVLQSERLQQFITEITENVPYYTELFKSLNLSPQDIKTKKDLTKLPFLDKETIKKNETDLKNVKETWFKKFNTGGSSGIPLIFYLGKSRISHDVGSKWRATRWWDVDIGDKEIVIWGSPIELGRQDYVRLVRDKLLRTQLLSAFNLSDEQMHEYLLFIDQFKPKMLFGYPSAIARLAEYGQKKQYRDKYRFD